MLHGVCKRIARARGNVHGLGALGVFAGCVSVVATLACAQGAVGAPARAPGVPLPNVEHLTARSVPLEITAGPDGDLWFTDDDAVGNAIGRMTPAGAVSEFPTPAADARPFGITAGPGENLWFTEGAGDIGRITPTGTISELPLPGPGPSFPNKATKITSGPDGNLWFTANRFTRGQPGPSAIGRITPTGTITEFPLRVSSLPTGIAAGPDGNLWFTEDRANAVGRITPAGMITKFPIPTAHSAPGGITAGPDGNLWFAQGIGKIGRITTSGTISEFSIPGAGGGPLDIAVGSDADLWFTEFAEDKIGRITPAGTITEFRVPTAKSEPFGITAGPDGDLWFTEMAAGKIGRITPAGTITEFPIPICVVPKLRGRTLTQARKLIARAHCELGEVRRPGGKPRHKLVVVAQAPSARTTLLVGAKVTLRLG